MFLNYLKIAWRNLRQNKSYTLINLLGLTLGMCCCILIALYAKRELDYNSFNKKADRIAGVGSYTQGFGKMIPTPYPLASALVNEVPEVDTAVTLQSKGNLSIGIDEKHLVHLKKAQYTQSSFFNVFSFKLIKGDKRQALEAPNSIVLTQKSKQQIFGDRSAMGRRLIWVQNDTTLSLNVTGIAANSPNNSSIAFDALISMNTLPKSYRMSSSWHAYSFSTFALLKNAGSFGQFNKSLHTLARRHFKENSTATFFSIPLNSYHLSPYSNVGQSGFAGNKKYLFFFGSVALFILLIACINYVNLATARALNRAREVGVRKTLGASRLQLMGQFIGEAVLLSVCSFGAAVYFSSLLVQPFNYLFGSSIALASHLPLFGWLLLAAIIVGILSGSYPALYLSGFAPSTILGGRQARQVSEGSLRKSLVIIQFAIASFFIIGSVIVYQQLQYTQKVDLGFNGDQVVSFRLPKQQMWQNRSNIRQTIASMPGVQEASVANGTPGAFHITLGLRIEDLSPDAHSNLKEAVDFMPAVIDYNYLPTLQIKLLAGRNFSAAHPSDRNGAFIANKKMIKKLGWTPKEAIGETLTVHDTKGKIVGVTENFHIASLHQPIKPVLLQLKESSSWAVSGGMLLAKLKANEIKTTVNAIKSKLKSFAPNTTFNYSFLDQTFDAMYRSDRRLGQVIGLFALIAIFIACMGLWGLAIFSVNRRTKEIGVRKVLGASVASIVGLLSKDFLKLVIIGFVIAVPLGWYGMHRWLQTFAYKINISWWIFLLAGALALVIALATVSWQSVRAALANPVDSLRSE